MSDDDLARLGRDWFTEIREADRAETKAVWSCGETGAAAEAGTGLLDWMLGDSPSYAGDSGDD